MTTTSGDVLLFVPNLIGYFRVIATLVSFVLMVFHPNLWGLATFLYVASFIGDLFDGIAARKLNQCSTFGGLLDMVTDRCSTLGLFFVLYGEYGHESRSNFALYRMLFLSLAVLDISSHWCQMYSTASLQIHHKSKEGNAGRFFLVRWYYDIYPFFGYCCIGAEVTYIVLYAKSYVVDGTFLSSLAKVLLHVCVPGCAIKQVVNVFQLTTSCNAVAVHDAKLRNESAKNK